MLSVQISESYISLPNALRISSSRRLMIFVRDLRSASVLCGCTPCRIGRHAAGHFEASLEGNFGLFCESQPLGFSLMLIN